MYPYYLSYHTRMQSFANWPTASEQKPENLSRPGFFIQVSYIIIKIWFITNDYYFLHNQLM